MLSYVILLSLAYSRERDILCVTHPAKAKENRLSYAQTFLVATSQLRFIMEGIVWDRFLFEVLYRLHEYLC